ncbi:MAG: hypothetical protein ACT4NY_31590 [Pseudonocardiales bacterium]
MLIRLHAVVAAGDGQQVIPALGDAGHVVKQGTQVANWAPLGVSSEGQGAPIGGDGEISVPARTADGRIIFVRVSRRLFLGGVGASAVGITAPPTVQSIAAVPRASLHDVNPLQHFVEMKKVLADSDNLFGPARVWSHLARDSQTTAFILARRSHLAVDLGNPADAIDAAEAARATARPDTRTAALAATFAGQAHALGGDADSSARSYDEARELLSCEADHENAYGLCFNGFNEGYLDVYRARSLAVLGRFLAAAEVFQTAIEGRPEGYWRDQGVYLAWQASAYAGGREAEQAADLGLQALAVACETGSARILTELAHLDDSLAQWSVVPKVRDFCAALDDAISHQT